MAKVKKKFDWQKFKGNSKMCVHCKTEKEANEFCRLMDAHGMKWIGKYGNSYLQETNYDRYKEHTCYYGSGQYGDLKSANKYGDKIYMFSAYDFEERAENENNRQRTLSSYDFSA